MNRCFRAAQEVCQLLVVLSPPATEVTEIESRQGICRVVALKKKFSSFNFFKTGLCSIKRRQVLLQDDHQQTMGDHGFDFF
jgi:hypothetical protein